VLQSKTADFCTSGLTITPGRSRAIDFSIGIVVDLVTLIQLEESGGGSTVDFLAFMTVFPANAWILTGLSILAVATFFAFGASEQKVGAPY